MKKIIKNLVNMRYLYNPLIQIYVYKESLLHNLAYFSDLSRKNNIAPVLKSNAYGHGLLNVADVLKRRDIPFFIVDTYYEAVLLKKNGIRNDILIIGYTRTENIKKRNLKNFSYTVSSIEQLKEIFTSVSKKVKLHLKIDTGMNRQGIYPELLTEAIEIIKKSPNIKLEGVCSHLADTSNQEFTLAQINRWNKAVEEVKAKVNGVNFFHLSATSGIKYLGNMDSNLIRLGLGLYGLSPGISDHNLKPALSMESIIAGVKSVESGESIGYNTTFKTPKQTKLAIVPAGYYEGIDLRLSNKGFLKVNNDFCPIIGRISMNITTIDVSDINGIRMNDKVVIISNRSEDKNSVENIAKEIDTIPYEVLVKIPNQLRRTLV